MLISVYLPLLAALALAGPIPLLGRTLPPAAATRVITALAALTAACTTWGFALLALTLVTATPIATETGGFAHPVPTPVAVLAAALLVVGSARAWRVVRGRQRAQRGMRQVCQMYSSSGELAVVADAVPQAFAVPGRTISTRPSARAGRILISTGLLRSATVSDRRVVLAHERAHLRHRHHHYRALVDIAAALNPLLSGARSTTAYLVERWADESAATATGSRAGTATALATVALSVPASGAQPLSSAALAFHRHAVPRRVRALQAPVPPSRPALAYLLAVPAVLAAIACMDATLALTRLLQPLLVQIHL